MSFKFKSLPTLAAVLCVVLLTLVSLSMAQNIVTGGISGTVTGSLVLVVVLSTKWQAQVQAQDTRAPLNPARKRRRTLRAPQLFRNSRQVPANRQRCFA